jgi:glucokinase
MLAGYITATTVQLARVALRSGKVHFADRQTFQNHDFDQFAELLHRYLDRTESTPAVACFGVAGTVINNEVLQGTFPWTLSARQIEREFALKSVRLLNDLVATAKGMFELSDDKFYTIKPGHTDRTGNIGLLAAGSGLGQALIVFDEQRYVVTPSEGGHSLFAPAAPMETELLEYLSAEQPYVEVEDVVSTRGLESIYKFLTFRRGEQPAVWFDRSPQPYTAVIEHALAGSDEVAVAALDMFIDCFASEAANLALKGITLGGLHLGGLIAPQIATALDQGRFVSRFVRPGRMRSILKEMPVVVIMDPGTALLGAACEVLGLRK